MRSICQGVFLPGRKRRRQDGRCGGNLRKPADTEAEQLDPMRMLLRSERVTRILPGRVARGPRTHAPPGPLADLLHLVTAPERERG